MKTPLFLLLLPLIGCVPGGPPPCDRDAMVFPCIPPCNDGVKNFDETDVDCGGHCPSCAPGKTCLGAGDCESKACENRVCLAATCADQIQNGRETDVDCGRHASPDGSAPDAMICDRCAPGKTCAIGDDCASGICATGLCTPSLCADAKMDGAETDVDCGGPYCGPCAVGKACTVATDCASMVCFNNACK